MANIALRKKIEGNWNNPEEATNGIHTEYDGNTGYTYAKWPENLTVDLEDIHEIREIRFLLFDALGKGGHVRDDRKYKYRLLTSENHEDWRVHYDTMENGYNGWQEFIFEPVIKARYIRIHCIWNSANTWFHVIEIEAYEGEAPSIKEVTVLRKLIYSNRPENRETEIGDAYPITRKLNQLTNQIEELIDTHSVIRPEPFLEVIEELRKKLADIISIEQSMDSIRREITEPVKKEIKRSNILGYVFGVVGLVFAILSLFLR